MDHNKEIAAAAKAALAPLGCIRKGRSRTWLDDHGWWVGIVEFQPSGWSKGSYLNVGACYLWQPAYPEPFLSFDADVGPRPWRDVVEGESFAGAAAELAAIASGSLDKLREYNGSVAAAADWLQTKEVDGRHGWLDYHLGIAHGLSGQIAAAQRHLRLAVESLDTGDWPLFRDECNGYSALLETGGFSAAILERIRSTRAALKLAPAEISIRRHDEG